MSEVAKRLMTVDEFLQWNEETDTRWELVDGALRAMAPPHGAHRTIVSNVTAHIFNRLRTRRPCRPENEAGIRIKDDTMWHADIAVTCEPPAVEIIDPLLIVEVLSPSTRANDLVRKLDDYKALSSVREVWMIDSERRWVQVWWRGPDGWAARDHVGAASLASDVLEAEVAMDALYQDSGV